MFQGAITFNGNINKWDVSSVTDMTYMFNGATSFNQDLNEWIISNVTDMNYMFYDANAFNGNLSSWNISSVTIMIGMLNRTSLSKDNYDSLLIGWSTLANSTGVQSGVTLGIGDVQYTSGGAAENAHNSLINDKGWTINDKGPAP
jgi:surface protein